MSRLRRKIGFVKCCHSEPEGAWEEEPCTLLWYDLEYFFRVYVSVEVVEREVDMVVVRPVASRASRRVERAIAAFPARLARVRRVRHITSAQRRHLRNRLTPPSFSARFPLEMSLGTKYNPKDVCNWCHKEQGRENLRVCGGCRYVPAGN